MTDPIGTEILEAAKGEVEKTLRGKIARSIYRLVAGGPGFKHLDQIRQNENTIEGRRKIDALVAEEVARQAIADPDYMERAKARFLGDMFSKQENLEAVATKANDEVLQLTHEEISSHEGEVPSEDWMNAFTREAEMASSDDLRQRLGKILAGETRRPGSFSRSTVRVIAEMEKETLELLNDFARFSIGQLILKGEDWDKGQRLIATSTLQSAGLVSNQSGTTYSSKLDESGEVAFPSQKRFLVIKGDVGAAIRVPILLLTQMGMELIDLLDVQPEVAALQEAVDSWSKAGIDLVFSGMPVTTNGQTQVPMEHIHFKKADQE